MKKQGKILIILALVSALALVAVIVRFKSSSIPTILPKPSPTITSQPFPNSGQIETFQSKTMKFSIKIPIYFKVEEKFTRVTLSDVSGDIIINRGGTNFDNLNDYLKDLDSKNKVQVIEQNKIVINNYETQVRLIKYPGGPEVGQRIYSIYVDYYVYALSTDSKSLYDDLDQISQSFRYIP